MNIRYLVAGTVLMVVLITGVLVGRSRQEGSLGGTAYAAEGHVKGEAGAPVRILEYSDFQCPACGVAQPVLKELLERYPGKAYLEFRHFPLSGHQWSHIAHQSAECAGKQEAFWPYHDLLFEHQSTWSGPQNPTSRFLNYARELGLDVDKFAACLADEEVRQEIARQKQTGLDLQVRSTPTFFINDERLVGARVLREEGPEKIEAAL